MERTDSKKQGVGKPLEYIARRHGILSDEGNFFQCFSDNEICFYTEQYRKFFRLPGIVACIYTGFHYKTCCKEISWI